MTDTISIPAAQVDRPRRESPRPGLIIFVLAFSGIMTALMQTVVLPINGELPQLLGAPASDTAWVVTATLLSAAVATPLMGRLGDMYGKRRMLIISLVLMIVGSVICGFGTTVGVLVVGRFVQGLALGFIPLAISIMRDLLAPETLASGTAIMSASLGIGAALGLPGAALLAQTFDWHILFWACAVLGAVSLVLVLAVVPDSRVRSGGTFDVIGGIGMAAGLVCLMLAVSKGADWGWGSVPIIGLFVAAAVIFVLWGLYELRVQEPLVDLRTTARRQVLFTNLAGLAFGFSLFAVQLIVPQMVQFPVETGYGLGGTLLLAGLVMAPQGIVMLAISPLSARVSRTMGPRSTLLFGALVVALGYGLHLVLPSSLWELVAFSCIIGAGVGLAYGALPLLIMGGVPKSETGAANSLNALMRSIGTAFASALCGVVLAQLTMDVGGHTLPSVAAFQVVSGIGCGAAVVALVLALFLPKKPVAGRTVAG